MLYGGDANKNAQRVSIHLGVSTCAYIYICASISRWTRYQDDSMPYSRTLQVIGNKISISTRQLDMFARNMCLEAHSLTMRNQITFYKFI